MKMFRYSVIYSQFEQPDASAAAIDYHSGRKLNKALIERMANCEYITKAYRENGIIQVSNDRTKIEQRANKGRTNAYCR